MIDLLKLFKWRDLDKEVDILPILLTKNFPTSLRMNRVPNIRE